MRKTAAGGRSDHCYDKWKNQPEVPQAAAEKPAAPGLEPEIQLGHGRSKLKDERLKRALKQHPQRDEPRLDSVEPDETPPRRRV